MSRAERRRRAFLKVASRVRVLGTTSIPGLLERVGLDIQPLGIYRKQHPLDCGRPRCGVCSGHKRYGHTLTRQERVAYVALAEWQRELDEG